MTRLLTLITIIINIFLLPEIGHSGQSKINTHIKELHNKLIYLKNGDIWLFDPINAEHKRIISNGKITNFRPSPEGNRLAYVSEGKLFLVDIISEEIKLLARITTDRSLPVFSPKGDTLLYISESEMEFVITKYLTRKVRHIWKIDLNENKKVDLTKESPFEHTGLNYSPDGRFISFSSPRENDWNVYIMELNTGRITKTQEGICSEWLDNDSLAIGDRGKISFLNIRNLSKLKVILTPSALDPGKFAFFSQSQIFYEAMSDDQDIEIRLIDINSGVYKIIVGNASAPVFVK